MNKGGPIVIIEDDTDDQEILCPLSELNKVLNLGKAKEYLITAGTMWKSDVEKKIIQLILERLDGKPGAKAENATLLICQFKIQGLLKDALKLDLR